MYVDEYPDISKEAEEEERYITAATEAAVHYNDGHNSFGRKRSYQKKIYNKSNRRQRRRSRLKKNQRSFGSSDDKHLKRFLTIALFMIIRSFVKNIVKGNPHSRNINNDLAMLESTALETLTLVTILELLERLVGKEGRDKILLAYTAYSVGSIILN